MYRLKYLPLSLFLAAFMGCGGIETSTTATTGGTGGEAASASSSTGTPSSCHINAEASFEEGQTKTQTVMIEGGQVLVGATYFGNPHGKLQVCLNWTPAELQQEADVGMQTEVPTGNLEGLQIINSTDGNGACVAFNLDVVRMKLAVPANDGMFFPGWIDAYVQGSVCGLDGGTCYFPKMSFNLNVHCDGP